MFGILESLSSASSYYKSYLKYSFAKQLVNQLPLDLKVQYSAFHIGVIFTSIEETICETHYHRDTSLLHLIECQAQVYCNISHQLFLKYLIRSQLLLR